MDGEGEGDGAVAQSRRREAGSQVIGNLELLSKESWGLGDTWPAWLPRTILPGERGMPCNAGGGLKGNSGSIPHRTHVA